MGKKTAVSSGRRAQHAAHEVPAGVVDVLRLVGRREGVVAVAIHQRHVDVAGVAGHLVERLGHEGDAATHLHRRLLHGGAEEVAVVAHLAHRAVADADLVLAGAPLVVAAFELAVGGDRVQQRVFLGQELGALLHRIALQPVIEPLVLVVQEEELELGRAAGAVAHPLHAPRDPVQHVAGLALDQPPVGPFHRAHDQRGVGLMAQDAHAGEVGHGEEVGVADVLAVVGAEDHVGADVEGHDGGAEGDAVVHRALEMGDVHRLAAGDAAIVAILDADALDAVGAQPVDDLIARAREAHRAGCRLAHSSTLPLVGSRGRTIPAEVRALKAGVKSGCQGAHGRAYDAHATRLRLHDDLFSGRHAHAMGLRSTAPGESHGPRGTAWEAGSDVGAAVRSPARVGLLAGLLAGLVGLAWAADGAGGGRTSSTSIPTVSPS